MFKKEFTISTHFASKGLKQLTLDTEKLKNIFTVEELTLLSGLAFFDEKTIVPCMKNGKPINKGLQLDAFGTGVYDACTGAKMMLAQLKPVQQIGDLDISKFNIVDIDYEMRKSAIEKKIELYKSIFLKYSPDMYNNLFK